MARLRARRRSDEPEQGVRVSGELFAPISAEVELCYQTFGDPDDEPLLLVMGLGGPMTWWDADLCRLLAEAGFFVIRYDNRDTGRSSCGSGTVRRRHLVGGFLGRSVPTPYHLSDLAEDAVGLLNHLNLPSAHVCGVSMGGMIAQSMAIASPSRVRSLVSIMSSTGKRTVGWQDPRILPMLLAPRKVDLESYQDAAVAMGAVIGSPAYPEPEEAARARAAETFARGLNGPGVLRQMLAVVRQPDRGPALASVRVPTTVIHGMEDRMVHPSGGRATARAIPGATLLLIPGMGHNLPPELWPTYRDTIRATADRAAAPSS